MPSRNSLFTALVFISMSASLVACSRTPERMSSDPLAFVNAAPRETTTLPNELDIAHPALYRAWQGNDAMAMRPYYADNALIVTSTDRFNGWDEIHDRWLTPTLKSMSNFMAMPNNFTREGSDIVENGRYSFTTTSDGQRQDVTGIYAKRWQKQPNGMWRVVSATIARDPVR